MNKREIRYIRNKKKFKLLGKICNIVDQYQLAEFKIQQINSRMGRYIDIDALENIKFDSENKLKELLKINQ